MANRNHKVDYEKLAPADASRVAARAAAAVEAEATALKTPTDVMLRNDIAPFEAAVRTKVTVQLAQAEFDALVSFTFNVGVGNFASSTLLKKINLNEHLTGSETDRRVAADAIQAEFAKWNKSSGRTLPGLTARRTSEAQRFLARARQQMAATAASFR
jgi:lysozyme